MMDFKYYLEKIQEIGFVEESLHSLVYVSGVPGIHPQEIVLFEDDGLGQVISFTPDKVEVVLLSGVGVKVGEKVVRTGEFFSFGVGKSLLGRLVDPLGRSMDGKGEIKPEEFRPIDPSSVKLLDRRDVEKPLETGVGIVDTVVPLGKGQRELIIGDRKTGKTEFLLQTVLNQSQRGTICIYTSIGQKLADIKKLYEFFEEKKILDRVVMIASSSSEYSGLIFLTPYCAMSLAEFFRDQGNDVLLILDDMTTHARTYREISLLAKRFPGRSSYPGDIFYIHSRLIERAGNFKKASITCLPVAESIMGDLSGYIQTNLMAMTDGHIFFDIDLYNQGKRPAVNPFLSVTRVGHQTQTPLQRDVSRQLLSFLVQYERMKEFLHFGAEVGEVAQNILKLGSQIDVFLNQAPDIIIPLNINILLLAGIWSGFWSDAKLEELKNQIAQIILEYQVNAAYREKVDQFISRAGSFSELVELVKKNKDILNIKVAGKFG